MSTVILSATNGAHSGLTLGSPHPLTLGPPGLTLGPPGLHTTHTRQPYILHTHPASRLGSPASRSARPTSTGPFVIKALNFGHELASVFESLLI